MTVNKISEMGKDILKLLSNQKIHNSHIQKGRFNKDRMVYEFDTSYKFNTKHTENIPTTILRSAEDCQTNEEKIHLDFGPEDISNKVKLSFQQFFKEGHKFNKFPAPNAVAHQPPKKKQINVNNSDSEDIFDGIGSYVYKPISLENENFNKQPETTKKGGKRPHKTKIDEEITSLEKDQLKESENRSNRRGKKSKGEKPKYVSKRKHSNEREEKRIGKKTQKIDLKNKTERKFVLTKARPQSAKELAEITRRNLAPRSKESKGERIRRELTESQTVPEERLMGIQRQLGGHEDPYGLDGLVEGGKVTIPKAEEIKGGNRGKWKRKDEKKGVKSKGKLDREWKAIQKKLMKK